MQPVSANFMDDLGNEFFSMNFTVLYVDIKMTADRRQIINIFGKGIDGDVVTSNGSTGETIPLFPVIKELQNFGMFGTGDFGEIESYMRRNKNKTDKKYANISIKKEFSERKTVAEKLFETVNTLEAESEANFFIDIL